MRTRSEGFYGEGTEPWSRDQQGSQVPWILSVRLGATQHVSPGTKCQLYLKELYVMHCSVLNGKDTQKGGDVYVCVCTHTHTRTHIPWWLGWERSA